MVANDQDAVAVCQTIDFVTGDGATLRLRMLAGLVDDHIAVAPWLAG